MDTLQPRESAPAPTGSLDGDGAGNHDEPYQFGRRPRASAPFPFTERQYARLLVFRSRVAESQASGRPVEPVFIDGGSHPAAA